MSVNYKMNATNRTAIRYIVILFVAICILGFLNRREGYVADGSGRLDYHYVTKDYDTNPTRRVGGFFDNCSPENMEDCQRNNPYEGLPLP